MTEQERREKVIKGLECCGAYDYKCNVCPYQDDGGAEDGCCSDELKTNALALLKAQEQRHRLEVHNIGNVDIPEGVTEEQFYAVMSNVVDALEHTDKGEAWPYDSERR